MGNAIYRGQCVIAPMLSLSVLFTSESPRTDFNWHMTVGTRQERARKDKKNKKNNNNFR